MELENKVLTSKVILHNGMTCNRRFIHVASLIHERRAKVNEMEAPEKEARKIRNTNMCQCVIHRGDGGRWP